MQTRQGKRIKILNEKVMDQKIGRMFRNNVKHAGAVGGFHVAYIIDIFSCSKDALLS